MQGSDRNVELRFLGVLDGEELHRVVVDGERHEAPVAPDAVVDVDHRRADVQFDQVLDHQVGIDGASSRPLHGGLGAMAEDFRLRDHRVFAQPVAAFDGRDGDRDCEIAILEGGEIVHVAGLQPLALQKVVQMYASPGRLRGEQHSRPGVADERAQPGRRIRRPVVGGKVRQRPPAEADAVPMLLAVRVEAHAPVLLQPLVQLGGAQEQGARRQDRALDVVAQGLVARHHLLQVPLRRG